MRFLRVPTGLIAAGVAAGAGGLGLGAKGAKDIADARAQNTATDERLQARELAYAARLELTNWRLEAFGLLQEQSLVAVVQRMSQFLRRHEKQVRESERELVDGLEVSTNLLSLPAAHNPADPVTLVAGAVGSVLAGAGVGAGLDKAVMKYGLAGTGRKILTLSGAARTAAAEALLGGGPKAGGGGGRALGLIARKYMKGGTGVLAAGAVAKLTGAKALADAQERQAQVAAFCAEMDLDEAALTAVDQRADELTELLDKLVPRAVSALDTLESVAFDPDRHAEQLQRTMMLVLAVRDVATTSLLTPEDILDERSETLSIKYRNLTREPGDD